MEKLKTVMYQLIVQWKRCAKDISVRPRTLEMAVASAVNSFKDGSKQVLDEMKKLKAVPRQFSEVFRHNKDYSGACIIEEKINSSNKK